MAQPSFLERFRTPIIAGVAIVGLLIVGYLIIGGGGHAPTASIVASGPKYLCDSLLTPGPSDTLPPPVPSFATTPTPATPTAAAASPQASAPVSSAPTGSGEAGGSPAASTEPSASAAASPGDTAAPSAEASPTAVPTPTAEPTLRLGFGTEILGRNHILNANQTIEYGFCPPTSGDHYNISGVGPIRDAVYPNNAEQPPGGWVHNLEHGWVVLLYSCKPDCPSADEMAQMQSWFDQAPTPDPSQGCDKEVLVARFDSMTTRFAELAWGRALLTDTFDLDTAKVFTQQWMDAGSEPEKTIC